MEPHRLSDDLDRRENVRVYQYLVDHRMSPFLLHDRDRPAIERGDASIPAVFHHALASVLPLVIWRAIEH